MLDNILALAQHRVVPVQQVNIQQLELILVAHVQEVNIRL